MEAFELGRILRSCLSPSAPQFRPPALHDLCIRTAAVYATTSLYEFVHHKVKQSPAVGGGGTAGTGAAHDGNVLNPVPNNAAAIAVNDSSLVHESTWDEVFPLLDQHFFQGQRHYQNLVPPFLQLVPAHLYERFLDHVLCALEVAGHFNATGKHLMQYIILFFPKHTRRFRAQRYVDRVLMPTVCCLHKCTSIEELYLEKADSPAITTYLLAHILKFMNNLRILALPKQCDDDVASILGINCPRLESVVLTGTNVTNVGLSWLLCCRNLHTVIMPGFFQGITPKGVALLLNGLPGLRHVIYDVMSDVLTYVDFNTSELVLPRFGLKTVLFHSMELLSSNHLELVTKLCPDVEWLSLDSALFYNLEGLGLLPNLRLLRLNYKSRPIDQTVVDFFALNAHNLTTLHFFEVKDIMLEDLQLTVGECVCLERFVMQDCSVQPLDRRWRYSAHKSKPLSTSVDHLQLFSLHIAPPQLVDLISFFRELQVLEMDQCDLDLNQVKVVLLDQPDLHTLRCTVWTHASAQNLSDLQMDFRNCRMQTSKMAFAAAAAAEEEQKRTMAARLLAEYVGFEPVLNFEAFSS